MTEREQIALIDRLRALPAETEWFEFKRNRCEPQEMGEYLSALANAACLASRPLGYAAGLRPNTGFEVRVVEHPEGRVVLFEVGPARDEPVAFYGTAHVRVGASKTPLARHPGKARALWTRGSDWSAEVCAAASLADLDPEAVAKAREQFAVKHPAQAAEGGRLG